MIKLCDRCQAALMKYDNALSEETKKEHCGKCGQSVELIRAALKKSQPFYTESTKPRVTAWS